MAKAGAARVFFDIVGRFQAERLLGDSEAALTIQRAIVMDAISGVQDAFTEMSSMMMAGVEQIVESFFEFEQQFVRVRKFYGDTGDVEQFAEAAKDMGLQFAFTGAESLKAAARTAQLKGVLKSQLSVIEATRQGLLMAQIGEMETEEGMNRFIQLAQQTGFLYGGLTEAQFEALDAERQANIVREASIHTLNQLNTIENSSVATMEDITFVLNQFASQAEIAGESIGEMAAMSALLLETGEEVSRAGTGLRMIYQRLGNANNEATKAIAELIPELDAQGVAQLKLTDVLHKIAPAYANMTAEEKRALAVNIAGSRHYVKFLKLMENQTRLTDLQTAAFKAQFPAIDEFNQKARSAYFESDQLAAAIENLRVEIGENLTEAYKSAYKTEALFLKGINEMVQNESMNSLIGNIIALGNVYKNIISPISNFLLTLGGVYIAVKTLSALQPKNIAQQQMMAHTYRETAIAMNIVGQLEKTRTGFQEYVFAGINKVNHSYLMQAVHLKKLSQLEYAAMKPKRELLQKDLDSLYIKHKLLIATKGEAAEIAKVSKEIHKKENALNAHNLKMKEQLGITLSLAHAVKLEKEITAQSAAVKGNRIIMDERGTKVMYNQVAAQKNIADMLQREGALMANEVVLYNQLNDATLKSLQAKNQELFIGQQSAKARLATLHSQHAEALAKGKSTVKIQEKILATQQEITQMTNERVAIVQLIGANEHLQVVLSKSAAKNLNLGQTFKIVATDMKKAGQTASIFNSTLMGMSMILPFVVDESDQMSAMMGVMAAVMITRAIPSIIAGATAMQGLAMKAIFAKLAVGGLAAGAAILVGYGAYKILDESNIFEIDQTITKIDNLNDSLDTTASILQDLAGAAGGAEVLEGMGVSFDDLKVNAELTGDILTQMLTKQASLRMDYETAVAGGNDVMAGALKSQLNLYDVATSKVQAIADAHAVVNDTIYTQKASLGEIIKTQESVANDSFLQLGIQLTEDTRLSLNENKLVDMYSVWYSTAAGETKRFQTQSKKEMDDFVREFHLQNRTMSEENIEMTKSYYENLLKVQGNGHNDMLNEELMFYDSITQAQNEFANAREELFFGQRENFTGAIYKQVTQGGVESLLHKTEIIQSNHFHGYNTEEMVQRVTKGVLDELYAQGVAAR